MNMFRYIVFHVTMKLDFYIFGTRSVFQVEQLNY